MPVTKTAKRALRGSARKMSVNDGIRTNLEKAIRMAKKNKTRKEVLHAMSLADRASKKNTIHVNKAARIKSALAKLVRLETVSSKPKKVASKTKK